VEELPALLEELGQGRGPLGELENRFQIVERVQEFVDEKGASGVVGLGQPLVDVLQGVATTVFAFVAVGFLTLFMLIEGPRWKQRIVRIAPSGQRQLWDGIAGGIHTAVGGWILGAILLSTLAGLSSGLVLFILGVPFAIALAMIVAVLDPIPFVGATLAAVIVTLAVLATEGFWPALIFLIFLLVYQNVVENHILVPIVYARTLRLSALVILLAVLVGGELAGIVGAIVAIPIAGSINVAITQMLAWRRGELAEPPPAPPDAGRAAPGSGAESGTPESGTPESGTPESGTPESGAGADA
jgi:predicted PurR-regulated permease PerM